MDIIELVKEIERLEKLYKHYRMLYLKFYLLCCSKERSLVKSQRDNLKLELERLKKERCLK